MNIRDELVKIVCADCEHHKGCEPDDFDCAYQADIVDSALSLFERYLEGGKNDFIDIIEHAGEFNKINCIEEFVDNLKKGLHE